MKIVYAKINRGLVKKGYQYQFITYGDGGDAVVLVHLDNWTDTMQALAPHEYRLTPPKRVITKKRNK